MSPFAYLLHDIRMRHRIRQAELAERMGYEQTYISALEVGTKGPPTSEFVEKLIAVLNPSLDEQEEIRTASAASQRKIALEIDSPPDTYWMLKELREHINTLRPVQIRMIREILQLPESLQIQTPESTRRLKRRKNEEARM